MDNQKENTKENIEKKNILFNPKTRKKYKILFN